MWGAQYGLYFVIAPCFVGSFGFERLCAIVVLSILRTTVCYVYSCEYRDLPYRNLYLHTFYRPRRERRHP